MKESVERRIFFGKVDANSNYRWTSLHEKMILLCDWFSILYKKCSGNITLVQMMNTFFRKERTLVSHNKCVCCHLITIFYLLIILFFFIQINNSTSMTSCWSGQHSMYVKVTSMFIHISLKTKMDTTHQCFFLFFFIKYTYLFFSKTFLYS